MTKSRRNRGSASIRRHPRKTRREAAPSPADAAATAATLERSLQSTCRGLAAFLRSLEQAGLRDALRPYQQMQLTLLQQRAWAVRHGRAELAPLWRQLAETAGAIEAIMAGFATVMDRLKDIDRVEAVAMAPEPPPARSAPPMDEAKVQMLSAVLGAFALSPTRAAALRAGGDPPVDRLIAAGIIEVRGRGRNRSFRLSAATGREIAAHLARQANGRDRVAGMEG